MENENIEKNIEDVEREKQEYLEENPEEDIEVEEIEFNLTENEIDEWINELTRLKEEKISILLSVDDETDLKINYEEEKE